MRQRRGGFRARTKEQEHKLDLMQARLQENDGISELNAYIEGCRQAEINEGEEPTPRFHLHMEFQELCPHDAGVRHITSTQFVEGVSKHKGPCRDCGKLIPV